MALVSFQECQSFCHYWPAPAHRALTVNVRDRAHKKRRAIDVATWKSRNDLGRLLSTFAKGKPAGHNTGPGRRSGTRYLLESRSTPAASKSSSPSNEQAASDGPPGGGAEGGLNIWSVSTHLSGSQETNRISREDFALKLKCVIILDILQTAELKMLSWGSSAWKATFWKSYLVEYRNTARCFQCASRQSIKL